MAFTLNVCVFDLPLVDDGEVCIALARGRCATPGHVSEPAVSRSDGSLGRLQNTPRVGRRESHSVSLLELGLYDVANGHMPESTVARGHSRLCSLENLCCIGRGDTRSIASVKRMRGRLSTICELAGSHGLYDRCHGRCGDPDEEEENEARLFVHRECEGMEGGGLQEIKGVWG